MRELRKENDIDLKWYVVHINQPGKELALRNILEKTLGKVKNITDYYCPVYAYTKFRERLDDGSRLMRRKVKVRDESGKSKIKTEKVLPLFAGMVYVRATQTALVSFLKDYFPIGTIMYTKSVNLSPYPVVIKDETMRKFREFNDNLTAEPVLLQRPFNDYAFNKNQNEPNDTIMVVDGVLAGRTGYLIRINGNRGLALQMENPAGNGYVTIGIPNIRSFHIVRVRNSGTDSASFATRRQRAVDLLVGMIQAAGISDYRLPSTLYEIVIQLKNDSSFGKLCEHLRKGKAGGKLLSSSSKEKRDLLASAIERLSVDDRRLILYLVFLEEQTPGYIDENWHNLAFRPFLTPTPGVRLGEGETYGKIHHKDFVEIIRPVDITERYFDASSQETNAITDTYYAHIGIRYQDGGYMVFANWDGLLSKYFMTEGKAARKILCGKKQVTYKRDKDGNIERDAGSLTLEVEKEKLMESFLNYAKPLYDVLVGNSEVKAMPKQDMTRNRGISVLYIRLPESSKFRDPLKSKSVASTIDTLISVGVEICTTIGSETHIKLWRDLLGNVWLRK